MYRIRGPAFAFSVLTALALTTSLPAAANMPYEGVRDIDTVVLADSALGGALAADWDSITDDLSGFDNITLEGVATSTAVPVDVGLSPNDSGGSVPADIVGDVAILLAADNDGLIGATELDLDMSSTRLSHIAASGDAGTTSIVGNAEPDPHLLI